MIQLYNLEPEVKWMFLCTIYKFFFLIYNCVHREGEGKYQNYSSRLCPKVKTLSTLHSVFDRKGCDWFILPLLLSTPTNQFSLDRKQQSHKQNQCSASDSVGVIYTRSYRSTVVNMTPTTTPSLVKTSLK